MAEAARVRDHPNVILPRPRLSTTIWSADPARYRAAQRRSLRTAISVAAILVAAVSILSGLQFGIRQGDAAWNIVFLDTIQAALAIAVALAMRTRLRRHPAPVAFAFLLLLPVVPLATLSLQPEMDLLVGASLALIPVGVALFIAWSHRIYAVWVVSYLALIVVLTNELGLTSLPATGTWQFVAAVIIGVAFGLVGQWRRDRQDHLTFDREAALRTLFQRSAAQQAALGRLNAELDQVLKREVQGRESIEAALAQIDAGASPEVIAATACAEILKLPTIDSAWVILLGREDGQVLAEAGLNGWLGVGQLPDEWARDLIARTSAGPWAATPQVQGGGGLLSGSLPSSPPIGTVWCPLRGSNGVIGVIGCGTRDPSEAERIRDLLPAITTYGSMVGALVAAGLESRLSERAARARIQDILNAQAFGPYFQPIVELRSGQVVGYEALTRFADGTAPDKVFELAARVSLGVELERATLAAALEASAVLPPGRYLGINASPELLHGMDLRPLLADIGRPIVLEITEHVQIDDYADLRRAIEALGPNVQLAVDDAGAGYASLRHILELAPDYVKLDIGLVRAIDGDPARQALIAGVGYFATKRKMRLVAEGIETRAELRTLLSVGIAFGQGYLLGRPQDARGQGPWPERIEMASHDRFDLGEVTAGVAGTAGRALRPRRSRPREASLAPQ